MRASGVPNKSLEVRGSPELQNGRLRALKEAWDDFLLETTPCQVLLFSVFLGRLQMTPRCQVPTQEFLEIRGSSKLHNCCLRALGKACDDFLITMLYELSWLQAESQRSRTVA